MTTTISTKYQIVIPKEVRETLNILPGIKLEVIPYENRIELIPIRPIKELKGILKGIDVKIIREKDRL
jgi:AbrB family looped-hinge helix DNA binding protein